MHLTLFLVILSCVLLLLLVLAVLLLVRSQSTRPQQDSHMDLALGPGYIFENSVEAILIADDSFQILTANRAAERLLDTGNLPGRTWRTCLHRRAAGSCWTVWPTRRSRCSSGP